MADNKQVSTCCKAPVRLNKPYNSLKRGETYWYVCTKCNRSCDAERKPMPDKSSMPTQIQKQIEEAVERFGEQFIKIDSYGLSYIKIEDNVSMRIDDSFFPRIKQFLRKELSTIATKSAESAEDEAIRSVAKAYGKFHRIIDDQDGLYDWFRKAITTGFSQKEQQ